MNNEKKSADEMLSVEPEISVLTSGASMRPMLRQHRDLAVIERVERPLKKGDVLLYRSPLAKPLVLHRIVSVCQGSYVLRGDNNYFTEYGITDADIVGVLKAFYRDGHYIDCTKNKWYRLYAFGIRHSYPIRYLWAAKLRPFLGRMRRRLTKSVGKG